MKNLLLIIFSVILIASCKKHDHITPKGPITPKDTVEVNVQYEVIRLMPVTSSGGTCSNGYCDIIIYFSSNPELHPNTSDSTFWVSPGSIPAGNQVIWKSSIIKAKSSNWLYLRADAAHYNTTVNLYINGVLIKSVSSGDQNSIAINTKSIIDYQVGFTKY